MHRIRDLIQSLSDSGIESPYLERLRKRVGSSAREGALKSLQQEILGEMAAALGRAESHVDEALLHCDLIAREIEALEEREAHGEAVGPELERKIADFNQARATAERRRWELMVHREALGIRRHDALSQHYPIPAERARPARG